MPSPEVTPQWQWKAERGSTVSVLIARAQRNRSPCSKALATNLDKRPVPVNCVLCEKANHSLNNCRRFMEREVSERHKFIQAKGLCFGCLKPGHRSKECEDQKTCDKCNKKHIQHAFMKIIAVMHDSGWTAPRTKQSVRRARLNRIMQGSDTSVGVSCS